MPPTQAMCSSFKQEILNGIHAFGTTVTRSVTTADTFRIALYTSAATIGASTTVYTTSGEVATGGNYTATGQQLTVTAPTLSGTTAYIDFADVTWSAATITAAGALIYNSAQANKAVASLSFGGDKISTSGDFTIQFPAATATDAIIRIA
jgi:hypothetical protein